MLRWKLTLATLAILVAGAACATTGDPDARSRTAHNRISAEELAELQGEVGNLHQVVSRLRPRWLQGDIVLYHNQSLIGPKDSLREFGLDAAYYLTYLDRAQAVAQLPGLGSRRIDGAIVMHTR